MLSTRCPKAVVPGLVLLIAAAIAAPSAGADGNATTPSCSAAASLKKSGRLGAAEAAYAKALENTTTEACAETGLQMLDEEHAVCARGAALAEAGRSSEARAAYEEALKTKPGAQCAAQGIRHSNEAFFDDPAEASKSILAWLGLFAVAAGLVAVLAALLLLGMTRLPKLCDVWPASWVRSLKVSIEAFENGSVKPEQGATTAALVRSRIEKFGHGGSTMTMVDSKAAIEETVWTKIGAINDQAKTVWAVFEAIKSAYPRRQFQATGILQPDGGAGHGLSISLRNGGEILGATTLWAQTFGVTPGKGDGKEVEPFQKLAVAAAAWISHVTATAAGEDPGGSKDPISWALFKVGSEWERDGEVGRAKQVYRAAIGIDSENWGARAQLGKLEDEAGDYDEASDQLRGSLKVLQT